MPNIRDKNGKLRDIAKLTGNFADWTITSQDVKTGTNQDLRRVLTAIFGQPGLIISELIVQNVCYPDGDLDLRGITSKSSLRFCDCSFRRLQLADASLRSLYLIGGRIGEIEATRLRLSGSFDMSSDGNKRDEDAVVRPTTCVAFLELSGAEIGGNLNLEQVRIQGKKESPSSGLSRFYANERLALRADGVKVRGNLFLRGVMAGGGLRINGCAIGRNVELQRAMLTNEDGYALSIAGGEIKGNLSFKFGPVPQTAGASPREGRVTSIVNGAIRLNNSTIFGRVHLSNLDVSVAASGRRRDREWVLYGIEAEGLEIGATLHTEHLVLNAPLNLADAVLKGGWIGRSMHFRTGAAPALIATGIEVAGLSDLETVVTNSFLMCVRAEFRGGLVMKDVAFQPQRGTKGLRLSDQDERRLETLGTVGDPYPTLNNWRDLVCGLNLDRATILGSFELEARVFRREERPGPGHQRKHEEALEKTLEEEKPRWQGAQTLLCLDGTTIPEIDKKALESFREFDFVDLMNCTYKSVVTRESDQEAASRESDAPTLLLPPRAMWRKDAQKVGPLGGVSALFKQKREKLIHFWSAPDSDLPHPFLDAPKVKDWLKVLDSEYAPLARRREDCSPASPNGKGGDGRPRWAQGYGRLRLAAAALLNGLLLLAFRLPVGLTVVALVLVATAWKQLHWAAGAFLAACLVGLTIGMFFGRFRLRRAAADSASASSHAADPQTAAGWLMSALAWFFGLGHDTRFAERLSFLLRYDYYIPASEPGGSPEMLEVPVFHPQPYLQLARTMRDAGFDRHAAEVIIAMEWRRTWYGDLSPGQKALQYFKGWFLEFGFNRMRPVKLQFLLILLSTLMFQLGYYEGAIIPAKSNEGDAPTKEFQCAAAVPGQPITCWLSDTKTRDAKSEVGDAKTPDAKLAFDDGKMPHPNPAANDTSPDARAYVKFNALLFAAETILPLADFGQKKNWIVEPVAGNVADYLEEKQHDPKTKHATTVFWSAIQDAFPTGLSAKDYAPDSACLSDHKSNQGFWCDKFWKNDFWKTFSFRLIALWALSVTVVGSLLTTLFIAGILGVITPKY